MSDLKQTDLSKRLRAEADGQFTPQVFREDLRAAADEIERYYTGMLNWKATAEAKDREFAERRTQPEATAPAQAAKTVPVLNERGKFDPYDTRISTEPVFAEITVPCDRPTDFDRELAAFEAWFALDPTDYGLKEIVKRGWFARAALASSANALSAGDRVDAERYRWLANRVLACDYGDNDTPGQIGWRIRHDLLAVNGARQPAFMYGESIDAAVDAAILQSQKAK